MSSMSVLTTFRVTNKEATELAFEKALALDAFSHPYYILTPSIKDQFRDLDILPFSYPSIETIERTARDNMMASIGTSLCIMEESVWIENVGVVHHTVGLNRLGNEMMWRPVDVYWLEGERCPFSIKK